MRSMAMHMAALRQSHFFIAAYSLTARYVRFMRLAKRSSR